MAHVEPKGWKFFDQASNREMMLIYEGPFKNWLAYKHPDGQWVTLRESTEADRSVITGAINKAHHSARHYLLEENEPAQRAIPRLNGTFSERD